MSMAVVPDGARLIAEELFTELDGVVHLLGSRCNACHTVTFPRQGSCPRCAGEDVAPHALARRGTLWTYTVQGFVPKTPYLGADREFQPYGVGYVDLAGEVLVEGRLVMKDLDSLRIGLPMELVLEPFHRDDDGVDLYIFAFAAQQEDGSHD